MHKSLWGAYAAAFMCATSLTTFADEMIAISPIRVEFQPNQSIQTVTLSNRDSKPQRFKISAADQVMDAEGNTRDAETFEYSAKKLIRFSPRQIEVAPGGRQNVRIMVTRPQGLPDGDYHTHLLFTQEQIPLAELPVSETKPDSKPARGARMSLSTIFDVAIPLVVQSGKVSSSVVLNTLVFETRPEGKRILKGNFTRVGNAEGKLFVRVVNSKGENLVTPKIVRLYREVNTANIAFDLNDFGRNYQGPAKVIIKADKDEKSPVISSRELVF